MHFTSALSSSASEKLVISNQNLRILAKPVLQHYCDDQIPHPQELEWYVLTDQSYILAAQNRIYF